MAEDRGLGVDQFGDFTIVSPNEESTLDASSSQGAAVELSDLLDQEGRRKLLLDFCDLDLLSPAAWGRLVALDKKVRADNALLNASENHPERCDVFVLTRLDQLLALRQPEALLLQRGSPQA